MTIRSFIKRNRLYGAELNHYSSKYILLYILYSQFIVLLISYFSIFYTLPKPAGPGGPRIHFMRMSNINPAIHTVHEMFRFHVMRGEIEINTDDNWNISGVVEIIDFSKIPFGFLKQYEPALFRQMASFLEYGIPTNLLGTHIVNASREAQLILGLVRNVMKQKNLVSEINKMLSSVFVLDNF